MKIEMMFGIVAALVIVFAATVFGAQYVVSEGTVQDVTVAQTTETVPTTTVYTATEIVDYDSEVEMQYVYVQSQNINGNYEELDEIQQRLYDVAEDYDPVEYDMLQEQVDNERTVAKENR
ncbi:MAG: hypothetical protein WC254_02585 [Candidatus Woesearchaeota archaeon]|jgi:hypothetical protein